MCPGIGVQCRCRTICRRTLVIDEGVQEVTLLTGDKSSAGRSVVQEAWG